MEVRLLLLGVRFLHGRIMHPQTQGKVERFNGTLQREVLQNGRFSSPGELTEQFEQFRHRYNFDRPHEALGMDTPGLHYRPSPRSRPDRIPSVHYPPGRLLRKVMRRWVYQLSRPSGESGRRLDRLLGGGKRIQSRHRSLLWSPSNPGNRSPRTEIAVCTNIELCKPCVGTICNRCLDT